MKKREKYLLIIHRKCGLHNLLCSEICIFSAEATNVSSPQCFITVMFLWQKNDDFFFFFFIISCLPLNYVVYLYSDFVSSSYSCIYLTVTEFCSLIRLYLQLADAKMLATLRRHWCEFLKCRGVTVFPLANYCMFHFQEMWVPRQNEIIRLTYLLTK